MQIIPIRLSVTNCFILKTKYQIILIDTGYEEDWDIFTRELRKAEIPISSITHLILTHHHDDHCGLLNYIVRENSTVRIVLSDKAVDLLKVGHNDLTRGGRIINKRVEFLFALSLKQLLVSILTGKKVEAKNNLKFPPFDVRPNDIPVRGEIRLRDIGLDLDGSIIETPGHCVDQIAVVLDSGECFAGDAAANMLRLFGTKYCVIFITDLQEYYKTWEKLIAKNAKTIYPAHGKTFPVLKLIQNIRKIKWNLV